MRRLADIISMLIFLAACDSLWQHWTVRNQLPCVASETTACIVDPGDGGTGDGGDPSSDGGTALPAPHCSVNNWCYEYPVPQGASLQAVGGPSVGDFWAVGSYGVIQRWNGSTWKLEQSGTLDALRGVWASSTSNAWVVGNVGTIALLNCGLRLCAHTDLRRA